PQDLDDPHHHVTRRADLCRLHLPSETTQGEGGEGRADTRVGRRVSRVAEVHRLVQPSADRVGEREVRLRDEERQDILGIGAPFGAGALAQKVEGKSTERGDRHSSTLSTPRPPRARASADDDRRDNRGFRCRERHRNPLFTLSGSDREAECAHHVAAVVGDPLRTPRRHPHPVDPKPVHHVVQRLGRLLLEHVRERAPGAREGHMDHERVVLVVPGEVVDEAEVDDVDPELGVHYVFERLGDLVVLLLGQRRGHGLSLRLDRRRGVEEPVVSFVLESVRQLRPALFGDLPRHDDVHVIRTDVAQDPGVVRDQQHAETGLGLRPVDPLGDDLERVDVEARVGLVEHRDLRLQHLELEDLVALFLAAGEALVHIALGELRIHAQVGHGLLDVLGPLPDRRGFAVEGRLGGAQEVGDRHARDLHRVLHREEEPRTSTLVDAHGEDVLAIESDRAARHGVLGMTGDRVRQRRLSGAVGTHDRVGLAGAHRQGDAVEDRGGPGIGLDRHVQVADLEDRHSDFLRQMVSFRASDRAALRARTRPS
ncbi:hypothetical protein ABE10_00475, partial [Bacillus toyonensis]|nr:hypothetical protein [Bacillus toyonensis]